MSKIVKFKDLVKIIKNNKRKGKTHLITHQNADPFWKDKKKRAKKCGVSFLLQSGRKVSSSSEILEKFFMNI
jgi:hypothetical protein